MFHYQEREQVVKGLETNVTHGLSSAEASKRLALHGPNQLIEKKAISRLTIFLHQFTDPLVIVLLGATALSIFLKEYMDAWAIGAIIILNAILGFIQEYRAEKAIASLKKLTSPTMRVLRDGKECILPAKDIVPGDIVFLESGDKINADIRLINAISLFVDESILTGESTTINKITAVIPQTTIIAERTNMLFTGTTVVSGKATGVVVQTGMDTELGTIAKMVQEVKEPKTPLQKRLKKLGILLGLIAIGTCAIVLVIGLLRNMPLIQMIFVSVSLAVSAIPEGLPTVVTITLALGVQKMYKKNALIRKLKAVETLGSVDIICADKTGTITQNHMTVAAIAAGDHFIHLKDGKDHHLHTFQRLWEIVVHCNDARLPDIGDPTELALLQQADDLGIVPTKKRTDEIPFTSENKYMVTTHDDMSYIKGSPEAVMLMCDSYEHDGNVHAMTSAEKKRIDQHLRKMTQEALRVLAVGYKSRDMQSYVFVGLVGLMDPPRPEVHEALHLCQKAGIRVIMITGDNKETALAVAKLVGITGNAMTGAELDMLGETPILLPDVNIYARVNPAHKTKILHALQQQGYVVAMTGDGVNDAPALKKADVGVAMSLKGTDVARESSDMILVDDNFASIVAAVEFGRVIYDNIKKCVKFLLAVNFDEILVILTSILLGMPVAMLPLQILRINLITDSLPTLALGMEGGEKNIMSRPPRPKREHILRGSMKFIIISTLLSFVLSFLLFRREFNAAGIDKARTMLVSASIFFELFIVFSVRSDVSNIRNLKWNKYLTGAVLISILLQIVAIYTPLSAVFRFVPLGIIDRLRVLGVALSGLIVFECIKLFKKRKRQ